MCGFEGATCEKCVNGWINYPNCKAENKCSTFSTANTGKYDESMFKNLCNNDKAITFTVRAKSDVHMGFFTKDKSKYDMYEIVIGGWGNKKSVIRRRNQGSNLVTQQTDNIVSSTEDRSFWADANNGYVRLGRGSTIGMNIVLSWIDPNPLIPTYVGFMTGWGATGEWSACIEDPIQDNDNCKFKVKTICL